ncbi:MAG: carbohydrate ABC transporter permease [Deltaproteobacteria bacterium]|nr:MAG: carbohydrate ABC transporter permease [Deltaproteobacteria bacterium]
MTGGRGKGAALFAAACLMTLYSLGPVAVMVAVSLARDPLSTLSGGLTLAHYADLVRGPSLHFLDYLKNSFLVSALSSTLSIAVTSAAAFAVVQLRLPVRRQFVMAVLALSMIPQVSAVGYLFKLMARFGLINTRTALILPYSAWSAPLILWLLVSYFSRIPPDLYRAALVDGSSRWQSFTRVIFPAAAPGIFSAWLLSFIFSFNEFLFALVLTSDYRARTVPVGVALFQGLHGEIPWGILMASAALGSLPVIATAVIFQKRIVSGLMEGIVRG